MGRIVGVVSAVLIAILRAMKTIRLPFLAGLALAVLLPFAMVTETVAAATAPLRPLTSRQVAHRLTGEVYGFLPYWLQTSKTPGSLRYDLLTTVAFFDVGLKSNGSVDRGTAGYAALMSAPATAVIRAAHAAGVRVGPDPGQLRLRPEPHLPAQPDRPAPGDQPDRGLV